MWPFSYLWNIKQGLGQVGTVLDVGCGTGYFGMVFNRPRRFKLTGLDLFKPYLTQARQNGGYTKLKQVNLNQKLPFPDKSFEVVVCLQTIEHLSPKAGLRLIAEMERIAKKRVIVTTPVGVCHQVEYDDNKYQRHLSSWYPADFRKLGFKVYGVGLKIVYGVDSHAGDSIKWWQWFGYGLSFLANPIAYFWPEVGAQMVVVKQQ